MPRRAATLALALALLALEVAAAPPPFTLEQVMSAPFASQLTAAPAGGRLAWVLVERGKRNVWVARAPSTRLRPRGRAGRLDWRDRRPPHQPGRARRRPPRSARPPRPPAMPARKARPPVAAVARREPTAAERLAEAALLLAGNQIAEAGEVPAGAAGAGEGYELECFQEGRTCG